MTFSPPNSSTPLWRRWLDIRSIQVRLTVGVVLATVVGMGSLAGWMGWRMQQILLTNHKQKAETTADRFEEDVSLYSKLMPTDQAVQKVIDHRATGDTAIWLKTRRGEILAQSETLKMGSWETSGVATELKQLDFTEALVIQPIQDWILVICASPYEIAGLPPGTLYVADDVTANQASFKRLIRNLAIASALGIAILTVAIALYVRRSLNPLRQLNQIAGGVTADNLAQSHLMLEGAPTEVEELARSYNMMLSRLSQAWSQQKRFVNDFSHELRTPLTLVQGYLQSTLRRCNTLTAPQREGLEIAAAEADRTIRLLQELLELARVESGQLPLDLQPLDLKQVVTAVVDMASSRHGAIDLIVEDAPLTVLGDRQRLQAALVQVMDNAIRYSSPDLPIVIRVAKRAAWATVQISDRGPGISLTDQADIFEPFYRVDADRARISGGTGLGLTVAKALVEAMKGQIRLQSTPGQGSIFTISLPI